MPNRHFRIGCIASGLSKYQKQRLTEKKLAAIRKGAAAKRAQRIALTEKIMTAAMKDIGLITRRELWLMGIMLYWAEGSKEKSYRPGSRVEFTNMDPAMVHFFIYWLEKTFQIHKTDLTFEIYIHETHRHRVKDIIAFWSKNIAVAPHYFSRIYFKKANIKTNRKNIDETYFGVLKIRVRCSTALNRRIAGWTQGVVNFFR